MTDMEKESAKWFKHILFINLEHRIDRLFHVREEFNKMKWYHAERFPAIKMAAGNIGCTFSHIKCVELAKSRNWPYVFICEDDITFTNPQVLMNSIEKFANANIDWDLLVIGGNNCPPFEPIADFCVRVHNVQTTTGYLVRQEYYDRLLSNYKEGVAKLMREPERKKEFSIDIYWKQLQQTDKWFMITPLTVIQYYDYSDIEERVVDYGQLMLDIDKRALMERWQAQQEKHRFSMNL